MRSIGQTSKSSIAARALASSSLPPNTSLRNTDRTSASINSGAANDALSIVPAKRPLPLTSCGEFLLVHGSLDLRRYGPDDPLTLPSARRPRPVGGRESLIFHSESRYGRRSAGSIALRSTSTRNSNSHSIGFGKLSPRSSPCNTTVQGSVDPTNSSLSVHA